MFIRALAPTVRRASTEQFESSLTCWAGAMKFAHTSTPHTIAQRKKHLPV